MEVITLLMTAATVALAGIGGLYYSYACSMMPGLRATDDHTFVSAMSRINPPIRILAEPKRRCPLHRRSMTPRGAAPLLIAEQFPEGI
ncbi:hypothetical protein [Pseudarthrobacter cellobiosi]|uniref:hypothetical protein n=1 Tax=Pseudarthrobacter cellobiosi TaxID=2953654 RepID=UPI00208DEA8A|nr:MULTISPECIES: hypothetical protein [unclassified Pseudarthrobacter]MCO4255255.1 hypothetical protein [Pseudarthrobacter sp. HLT1-5]MCO4275325.1 hypothetical protein [Pseudarthrobacter sp. HLT3-5]